MEVIRRLIKFVQDVVLACDKIDKEVIKHFCLVKDVIKRDVWVLMWGGRG